MSNQHPIDEGITTLNTWVADRWHNQYGPSVFFRTKYGHKVEFQSSNHGKNERHPVLNIQQFDRKSDATEAVIFAREYWAGRASVRVHQRVTRVDSIELRRWFVITRKAVQQ